MAYDKEKIKEARKALTIPKYEAFDDILGMGGALELFNEKFDSEADLVQQLLPQIKPLIESVYLESVENIYTEYWFRNREYGYFDFRVDVYVIGNKRNYVIEVKNPTHNLRESLYGISQLMMYDIVLEQTKGAFKPIYLSSIFEPMVIQFIKKYNLDIDVFLWNGTQTAHWDNTLTN